MTWIDRTNWIDRAHVGDCRALLRRMIRDEVKLRCIVTSPPYWGGLRDYGHSGQFGLEPSPQLYVRRMVSTFRLAREVLMNDGTLWLNMGDAYMHSGGKGAQGQTGERMGRRVGKTVSKVRYSKKNRGLKAKDLIGMPWRVALALQADGWYLRTCIIWHKLNPMPESVTDRPTTAHEYIFLLSKSPKYYYDIEAVREPVSEGTHARIARNATANGSLRANGGSRSDRPLKAVLRMPPVGGSAHAPGSHKTIEHTNGVGFGYADGKPRNKYGNVKNNDSFDAAMAVMPEDRNLRTVWSFPTEPFKGPHFATFPRELAARCIVAGSEAGDIVLDPFFGSGTTGEVALSLGRHFIGLEINAKYVELFKHYRSSQLGMQL